MEIYLPHLVTDDDNVNKAFKIAVGDLLGNVDIVSERMGLLPARKRIIMAGLDYNEPWTRDTAMIAWYGSSLILPGITRNTLLSVLKKENGKPCIGGQYWDAIIWATGAWQHYLYTGDKGFLSLALEVIQNSLKFFEETEFDSELNLFRGPACYGDGVSAYPDEYAETGGESCILAWVKHNQHKKAGRGYGIPMFTLSTNCIYYNAYRVVPKILSELGKNVDKNFYKKANLLKQAINTHFWNERSGTYRYIIGPLGTCEHQEGLGHAFVLLFNVADKSKAESIFKNQYIAPAGIPCVWPTFQRYKNLNSSGEEESFGRHSGTVWPQIQGFWAAAAILYGKYEAFRNEFNRLTYHVNRDAQFAEVYHPLSGKIYGGWQENGKEGIVLWRSSRRQSWCAAAYINMILMGIVGLRFEINGIHFSPYLPENITRISIENLKYRRMILNIQVEGHGNKVREFLINNKKRPRLFLPAEEEGKKNIHILLS
jgi:glycogen debranching enzyme